MAHQRSFLRRGLLFGVALCGLLFPVLSLADTSAQDTGTDSAKPLRQDESHWRLRFNVSWFDTIGDSISASNWDRGASFGAGAGAGLQAEYRVSPNLGFELGLLAAGGVHVSNRIFHNHGRFGLSGFVPLSIGLNFHLTPTRTVDFYAGPQIALVAYDTEYDWWTSGNRNSNQTNWAWGLVAGLDVPLGKRGWLFNANLRYLDISLSQSRGDFFIDGDFNPVILSVGFGYAF